MQSIFFCTFTRLLILKARLLCKVAGFLAIYTGSYTKYSLKSIIAKIIYNYYMITVLSCTDYDYYTNWMKINTEHYNFTCIYSIWNSYIILDLHYDLTLLFPDDTWTTKHRFIYLCLVANLYTYFVFDICSNSQESCRLTKKPYKYTQGSLVYKWHVVTQKPGGFLLA